MLPLTFVWVIVVFMNPFSKILMRYDSSRVHFFTSAYYKINPVPERLNLLIFKNSQLRKERFTHTDTKSETQNQAQNQAQRTRLSQPKA